MSPAVAAPRPAFRVPGWALAALLLLATAALGPALGGVARPVFVAGCAVVGWAAWRRGAADHLQGSLALFTFAPFVRRLVDLSAGFDQAGIMLIGPLLAIMAPAPVLLRLLDRRTPVDPRLPAMLVVAGCVAYATSLTLIAGEWMNAASGALKWLAPLIYAAAIRTNSDETDLVEAAAGAFLAILPLIGLYGIVQYVDPPAWDRFWMEFASITSAGFPLPYMVRTFSTMNSPASFATFTAAGLLLVLFLRSNWLSLLLCAPAILSLLLSLYRTAWLSLAAGILVCLLFGATRGRAAMALVVVALGVGLATVATPFGDAIEDRLSTLGQGAGDDSARERLHEFVLLWNLPDSSLVGSGFTVTDAGSAGAMQIDGMIVACWLMMGIVVGLVCLFALVWAACLAIAPALRGPDAKAVVVAALAAGALAQMPLANISSGELGFLFWLLVAIAPDRPAPSGSRPAPFPTTGPLPSRIPS